MLYQVEVKEILSRIVEVEADDAIDARLLAEEKVIDDISKSKK